jgi:hypothetical protein
MFSISQWVGLFLVVVGVVAVTASRAMASPDPVDTVPIEPMI